MASHFCVYFDSSVLQMQHGGIFFSKDVTDAFLKLKLRLVKYSSDTHTYYAKESNNSQKYVKSSKAILQG